MLSIDDKLKKEFARLRRISPTLDFDSLMSLVSKENKDKDWIDLSKNEILFGLRCLTQPIKLLIYGHKKYAASVFRNKNNDYVVVELEL